MEQELDPQLEAHRTLLAEIGLARRKSATQQLEMLDRGVRFRGSYVDAEQRRRDYAILRAIEKFAEGIEHAVDRCHASLRGRQVDGANTKFSDWMLGQMITAAGSAGLRAVVEEVGKGVLAEQKLLDDARHQDEERERRQREARLDDEVAATSVEVVLAELARAGVHVSATAAGKISVKPPQISVVHQRVLESKRADALRVLAARNASAEI